MPFDWTNYMGFARELAIAHAVVTQYPEACWRTVVSRSYYAAYGLAAAYYMANGGPAAVARPDTGMHERVIDWFRRRPTRAERLVATRLQRLKRRRLDADYREHRHCGEAEAMSAYAEASRLLAHMRTSGIC